MASITLSPGSDPCGSESPHASALITEDQSHASITNVEARFKVFARNGGAWDIKYYTWCKPWTNGVPGPAVCIATNDITGVGTGDWAYTNVTVAAPFITATVSGVLSGTRR